MDKGYIERQYEQIVREWKYAINEDEKWELRKRMADLERTTGTLFGFEYMDELHTRYTGGLDA